MLNLQQLWPRTSFFLVLKVVECLLVALQERRPKERKKRYLSQHGETAVLQWEGCCKMQNNTENVLP